MRRIYSSRSTIREVRRCKQMHVKEMWIRSGSRSHSSNTVKQFSSGKSKQVTSNDLQKYINSLLNSTIDYYSPINSWSPMHLSYVLHATVLFTSPDSSRWIGIIYAWTHLYVRLELVWKRKGAEKSNHWRINYCLQSGEILHKWF